ncbi:hypothetical protein MP638_003483 [Amoeboaphelidium occidentale]|nr:hypothetical protein MP638_003483 [Amoeboaphelidium occidentale]
MTESISVRLPTENTEIISLECTSTSTLTKFLSENYPSTDFYYTQNDLLISSLDDQLSIRDATITVCPKGRGGKGGFGANLKRSGKLAGRNTTNFDACRDLQGRRLGDLRRAQLLADEKEKESQSENKKKDSKEKRREEELREIVEAEVEEMLMKEKKTKGNAKKEDEKKESDGVGAIRAAVNAAKRLRETGTKVKDEDSKKKKKKASLWNSSDTSDSE